MGRVISPISRSLPTTIIPVKPPVRIRRIEKFANLTGREREVASFLTEGISNQEIADRLGRSVGTVKAELHSVFKKLSVTTRTQLLLCITGAALTC